MRVAVIGAGVGGLAVAAALARVGVEARVFEQGRGAHDAAAGLQLSPNAVRPALRLGLGPALREHGVAIDGIEVRSWTGRPIAWTPLGARCTAAFGAPYYAVHRSDLHAALAARLDPGVVCDGRAVRSVEDTGRVRFADGTEHHADAVVGADGVRSVVRSGLADRPGGPDALRPSGLVALRGLVDTGGLPAGARAPLVRVWLGPGAHLVCYPVSAGRALSFTAVLPEGRADGIVTERGDDLAAAFPGWAAAVRTLAGAARHVHRAALVDREPLGRWTAGRVTVAGDAAHPMLPFLAQGANQAVEDAVALAVAVRGVRAPGVPAALERYAAGRTARTAGVVRAAREHAAVVHLPDGPRQRARDEAMRRSSGLAERAWLYGPTETEFENERRSA